MDVALLPVLAVNLCQTMTNGGAKNFVKIDGRKLAALRESLYMSQAAFAALCGRSAGNMARIEQGNGGMRRSTFGTLAKALNRAPEDLLRQIGLDEIPSPLLAREPMNVSPAGSVPMRLQPIRPVKAHGLSDTGQVDEDPRSLPFFYSDQFVCRIDGECMEPDYRHGDLAFFSPSVWEESGFIVGRDYVITAADDDGATGFKRFLGNKGNTLIFGCANPSTKYAKRRYEVKGKCLAAALVFCGRFPKASPESVTRTPFGG
jgi:transcriptional regulator with XRE-family HTH domain